MHSDPTPNSSIDERPLALLVEQSASERRTKSFQEELLAEIKRANATAEKADEEANRTMKESNLYLLKFTDIASRSLEVQTKFLDLITSKYNNSNK